MVQPPATLDGYSFSHRLEVTKNVKGSNYGIPDGRLAFRTRQRAGAPLDSSVTYNTAVNGVSVMAQLDTGGGAAASAEAPILAPGVMVKLTGSKKPRSRDLAAVAEYSLRTAELAAKAAVDGSRLFCSCVWGSGRVSLGMRTDLDSLYHTIGDPELVAQYRGDAFAVTAVHKVGPGADGLRVWAERRIRAPLTAALALAAADRAATAGLAYQWGDGNQVKGKVTTLGGGWGTWSAAVTLGSLLPRVVLRACLEVDGSGDKLGGASGRARLGAGASVSL